MLPAAMQTEVLVLNHISETMKNEGEITRSISVV